jgi:hypothetical protein
LLSEAPSTSSTPSDRSSKPGRTITSAPAKPTSTPVSRRTPTFSPSSGIDSTVTRSGVRNMIVVAVASGIVVMPTKNIEVVTRMRSDRTSCSHGRPLRRPRKSPGPMIARASSRWKKNRDQITCGAG